MRYIDKSNRSKEFDDFIDHFKLKNREWKRLKKTNDKLKDGFRSGSDIQLLLHQHLWTEQKGLCIYCEQELEAKLAKNTDKKGFSHIEHLRPKGTYKDLRFEQSNLSVSCDGFDTRNQNPITEKEFCGHKKHFEYDEDLFLNPLEVENVEDYFEYDIEGNMYPNQELEESEKQKAIYTIDLLNLQHDILIDMRKNQYEIILEEYLSYETETEKDAYIEDLLNPNHKTYPAFYSMLKKLF